MDVAADWREEQREDAAAVEPRRLSEREKLERATDGMTFEERMAFLDSLRQ